MQTASMERSSRPSTPLKRYMLPETSTTRRRRLGFCWGLPGWQGNTTEQNPAEMGKLSISKDKPIQRENPKHFANQENFIQQMLFSFFGFFFSKKKTPTIFLFQTSSLTDNSTHSFPSPSMTGNKIPQKIPHMLVRKILFLFQFWSLTFYFSEEMLKSALSGKAHNGNAFPWHAELTGTVYDCKNLSAEVNNIPKMFEILFWLSTSSIFILMLKPLFSFLKTNPICSNNFWHSTFKGGVLFACNEICLDSCMRLLKMIWQKNSHNINK